MKKRVMNPYLPLWEYIPDGEPRIFGDRLYVYGSHDFAGGWHGYCPDVLYSRINTGDEYEIRACG